MFSIDLLKGKGLPQTFDAKRSALKAVPILIPLLAVVLFASSYQRDRTMLQDQQQTLKSNQQQLEQYTKDVIEYNKVDARIKGMENCLKDISKALSYRIQVSDILVELVQTLPENIFIYDLKMDRTAEKIKEQQEDSAVVKQRLVVRRQMQLVLCGYNANQSDAAVQEYVSKLEQSPLLSEVFAKINPPARQQGKVGDRDTVQYVIECVLREQG